MRGKKRSARVPPSKVKYHADHQQNWGALVEPLPRGRHTIADAATMLWIPGDAPKNFIRIREYDQGIRRPTHPISRWVGYIAKVGSKWYPIESITEHLLTRIGEVLGVRVAQSQLRMVGGQVRFLS